MIGRILYILNRAVIIRHCNIILQCSVISFSPISIVKTWPQVGFDLSVMIANDGKIVYVLNKTVIIKQCIITLRGFKSIIYLMLHVSNLFFLNQCYHTCGRLIKSAESGRVSSQMSICLILGLHTWHSSRLASNLSIVRICWKLAWNSWVCVPAHRLRIWVE